MRGILVVRLLLAAVAVASGVAAGLLGDRGQWVPTFFLGVAVVLLWVATRPLHPVVAPLYRLRLRSAWTDWTEALERWYASDDPEATAEALLATDGILLRVSTMKPPAADRAEHERRVAGLAAYARALHAWADARRTGDEAGLSAASERLRSARDALDRPEPAAPRPHPAA